MSKYLIRRVETFRVDSESEAKAFIEEQRKNPEYTLTKYANEYKERKVKGEVVDSWYRVVLTKDYNDEKEPIDTYYESSNANNNNDEIVF